MNLANEFMDSLFYRSHPKMRAWKHDFDAIDLHRSDLAKLLQIFQSMDSNKSGSIEFAEFLAHVDLDNTKFNKHVFLLFDMDGTGTMDFHEFCLSVWNFCTLGKYGLTAEIDSMLVDVYGPQAFTSLQAKSVSRELNKIEVLNLEQFLAFSKFHEALLFPAFQVQSHLRDTIMGGNYWDKHVSRREHICKGRYVNVYAFIHVLLSEQYKGQTVVMIPFNTEVQLVLDEHGRTKYFMKKQSTLITEEEYYFMSLAQEKKRSQELIQQNRINNDGEFIKTNSAIAEVDHKKSISLYELAKKNFTPINAHKTQIYAIKDAEPIITNQTFGGEPVREVLGIASKHKK
eukprot:gene12568-16856_t